MTFMNVTANGESVLMLAIAKTWRNLVSFYRKRRKIYKHFLFFLPCSMRYRKGKDRFVVVKLWSELLCSDEITQPHLAQL
jgi:hypothetical protein